MKPRVQQERKSVKCPLSNWIGKAAIVLTCALAPLAQGGQKEKTKPSFIVLIEDGMIKVCDEKQKVLGAVEFGKWVQLYDDMTMWSDTLDNQRHIALDAVAAVVAGDGGREHTVDPFSEVITVEESRSKGNERYPITLTMEGGMAFAILRDSKQTNPYRAQIIRFTAEELQAAQSNESPATQEPDAKKHTDHIYVINPSLPRNVIEISPDYKVNHDDFWDYEPKQRPANVPSTAVLLEVVQRNVSKTKPRFRFIGWCYMEAEAVNYWHGNTEKPAAARSNNTRLSRNRVR